MTTRFPRQNASNRYASPFARLQGKNKAVPARGATESDAKEKHAGNFAGDPPFSFFQAGALPPEALEGEKELSLSTMVISSRIMSPEWLGGWIKHGAPGWLRRNAEIRAAGNRGRGIALRAALEANNTEAAKLLLDEFAAAGISGRMALSHPDVCGEHANALEMLLRWGAWEMVCFVLELRLFPLFHGRGASCSKRTLRFAARFSAGAPVFAEKELAMALPVLAAQIGPEDRSSWALDLKCVALELLAAPRSSKLLRHFQGFLPDELGLSIFRSLPADERADFPVWAGLHESMALREAMGEAPTLQATSLAAAKMLFGSLGVEPSGKAARKIEKKAKKKRKRASDGRAAANLGAKGRSVADSASDSGDICAPNSLRATSAGATGAVEAAAETASRQTPGLRRTRL